MERRSENALVFMAKWPEPGRTKTRLCPPLSIQAAAELARCFLLDMLAGARETDADLWLAFAPRAAEDAFRALAGPEIGLIPAEFADFGASLRTGQEHALAQGYRRVALVGSDLPQLPVEHYATAFDALEHADAAIGPSGDGGYYLLAAAAPTPALFQGVTWSTSAVFEQTLMRAREAGLRLATVPRCDDADTAAELPRLLGELRERPGAGHTLTLLEHLCALHNGLAAD